MNTRLWVMIIGKSQEQLSDESGNRSEYREVSSTMLLQMAIFRD